MAIVDIKKEVAYVVEQVNKANKPAEIIKVKEYTLHHHVEIHCGQNLVTWIDEKHTALQVVHRVAAALGLVEKKYTGHDPVFRYYEAR
jgi:hypothetical protein